MMTDKGMEVVEQAKLNGAWKALDAVDNLELPNDLKATFHKNIKAAEYFEQFPSFVKKGILEWIQNAKRNETRQKRITETVTLAMENIRANQYKPK